MKSSLSRQLSSCFFAIIHLRNRQDAAADLEFELVIVHLYHLASVVDDIPEEFVQPLQFFFPVRPDNDVKIEFVFHPCSYLECEIMPVTRIVPPSSSTTKLDPLISRIRRMIF